MEPVETLEYKGKTIEIHQDMDPQNPRTDFEQIDTMVCFHKRYNLGDKHDYKSEDYSSWDEMEAAIRKEHKPVVLLPLYLYDHSGITISTSPFHCRWDSGQIGFVFINRKDALANWTGKRVSPALRKKCEEYIASSVNEYDQYLRGDVYGYIIKGPDGEEEQSCWGYYGEDYTIESAKEAI